MDTLKLNNTSTFKLKNTSYKNSTIGSNRGEMSHGSPKHSYSAQPHASHKHTGLTCLYKLDQNYVHQQVDNTPKTSVQKAIQ